MDAMIDDVHFKLLPIVQVHDATEEYFSLGNFELVVALKHIQIHTHNQKHCGLPLKLVFLPQCEAILLIKKKSI